MRTVTRPASRSTDRCFDTVGWLMGRASTKSPAGRSPSASMATMAMRCGSDRACRARFMSIV
ncbi:hypothetical protein D3C75_1195400 [compost metagenome]